VNDDEASVRVTVLKFYEALEDLLRNRGTDGISDIWHHDDGASTAHPFGHWAIGWDEVWAAWQESAAVFAYYRGHDGRTDNIGNIHDLKVTVVGELAFAIGVYKSVMYFPDRPRPLSVKCTDVLQKRNGAWKMLHHHADEADADYQQALARLVDG
jgi:ketosteroid isomerase-like protein